MIKYNCIGKFLFYIIFHFIPLSWINIKTKNMKRKGKNKMAKTIKIHDTEVIFHSSYEKEDFAKWLLNKIHGNVVKQSEWMSERRSDYKLLKRVESNYYLVGLMSEKPKEGKICYSGFSFTGYILDVEYLHYSEQLRGKAVVLVPRYH